jgi:hypothetical protein
MDASDIKTADDGEWRGGWIAACRPTEYDDAGLQKNIEADSDHDDGEYGPADHVAHYKAVKCQGDEHGDDKRDQDSQDEVEMPEKLSHVCHEGANQEKFTLGKVEDSTGLEDNGEPKSDQRIDAAQHYTGKDELDKVGHCAPPPLGLRRLHSDFVTEIRFDDLRIRLNLRRQTLRDDSPEIQDQHTVGNTHDHCHIMLNENLSDS